MFRRTLLAAAASMLIAPTSRADWPVIDMTSVAKAVQQIQWLRDQYQVSTQQLQSLTNSLNLNSIAPQLLNQGIQNPLSQVSGQINGVISGTTSAGVPGAQQMLQQDRLFQPSGSDFMAETMNGAATTLANLKAAAMQLIGVNTQRIGALNGMQADLEGAPDVATVERINGRIGLENQTLAAQQAQGQQLVALAALQQQTNDARTQQRIRSDDESATTAISGSGTVSSASTTPAAPTFVGN